MSAIEKGQALLRLRGAGATIESIRQMSNIYGEDSNLVPTAFVTDKFQSAKAITAFGGYAVFKGLMTDEQVYAQRDVFGADYSVLDFTLPADQFKAQIDALETDSIIASNAEATRNKSLGITVGKQITSVAKLVDDINPSDMAVASQVSLATLDKAIERLTTLRDYKRVVVESARELQAV
jgi:hypothetical protein